MPTLKLKAAVEVLDRNKQTSKKIEHSGLTPALTYDDLQAIKERAFSAGLLSGKVVISDANVISEVGNATGERQVEESSQPEHQKAAS